jgi:hypothetical protein
MQKHAKILTIKSNLNSLRTSIKRTPLPEIPMQRTTKPTQRGPRGRSCMSISNHSTYLEVRY